MAGRIDARLKELKIELPDAPAPAANYIPYVVTGNLVFVSGQVPRFKGQYVHVGKVGETLTLEDGQKSARLCALNLIAQLKQACGGDLDRVKRVVKLGGFVNSTPNFANHPQVINGASDLMGEIFGEAGKHARFAVGVADLPGNVATEIDGIFEIA
ncbi:MAG: RidA family protein [Alphaproteobacteria bacterium]